MFIVAVTGGIATGKSTVSRVFAKHGIPVVDADQIARDVVQPGKSCWRKIRETFGDEILHPSKELNREALGRLVFGNKELITKLNKITHPVIHRTIAMEIVKYFMQGHAWIVLDTALLFESGLFLGFIYKIITVSCDFDTQLERLIERNEYSVEDARKRIASQMPLDKKCEQSNFVIDNTGTLAQTEAEAERIFHLMNESNHHWRVRCTLLGIVFAIGLGIYYLNKLFHFMP